MTFLFLIFLLVIVLAFFRLRAWAIALTLVNLILCLWMLWYHATSTLEIMW